MSLKITGSTRLNDPSIVAQQMAENTALQYQLGYEDLQRQLMGDDPNYTPSPTVSIIDPIKTIRLPRQKLQKAVLINSQGYNAKQMTQSNIPVIKSNPNAEKAKEFITQTRALDNDLDHALSLMKWNNKDEFYKDGTTGNIDADLYDEIIADRKEELDNDPTVKELTRELSKLAMDLHHMKKVYAKHIRTTGVEDEEQESAIEELEDHIAKQERELHAMRNKLQANSDIIPSFVDEGYTVDRLRNKNKKSHHKFVGMQTDEYNSTITGEVSN